jgi:alcohol dehydrogenase YqhD (iron-dependent ADH family)
VISRRSIGFKRGCVYPPDGYPKFSLIDPTYTLTLPPQQLRNGVYDALCHCIDHYLTPTLAPMFDQFYMCVVKELIAIGPDVVKEGSSLELHERLIMAASFALNNAFQIAKPGCYAIHQLGHQLTAKYGIDHGATLCIVTKPLLESQFEARKPIYALSAEGIFGVDTGSLEEKATAFIEGLQ